MRLAVALLVAVCGCAKPPQCPVESGPARPPGAPFLWRVEKADGGDALWLYGTYHDVDIDGVPPVALDALEHSVRLVTELGATTPDRDVWLRYARVEHGLGIDQRLVAGDWYDLRDALRTVIKEDDLRRAAPWYAMTLLTTHMAPSPGKSMDVSLGKRAEELAMPVEALETWEEQLSMLASTVTVDDLQEAIEHRDTMKCDIDRDVRAYKAGDDELMTAIMIVPRTAERMLYARNRAWVTKLEPYLAKGGAFVAVGVGHMLGDHGLPALFARAGYRVERVARP